MTVDVNVSDRILSPCREVFDAIVDHSRMSRYFITGASGPMKAGTTVEWEFADVGAKIPVQVLEIEDNQKVVYESTATGPRTRVTIDLKPVDAGSTVVGINETGWPLDEQGVQRALGQTAGWTYFLCCLKAYLQYDINLRLGLTKRLNER